MPQFTDQFYLRTDQYRDASNLSARILLHRRFSTNSYPWQRWVFDRLDLPDQADVLDVGCGPADLWFKNQDRMPGGWTVVLSDLSRGMVDKARSNLQDSQHRFVYRVLDAQALPFPSGSFDGVIVNHTLHHVPDRDRALCEMRRVLRARGRLYATTNGLHHLRELRKLVDRYSRGPETGQAAALFGLENGGEQLSRHFAQVTRHRQQNALVVTEPEPLVAYVRSMMRPAGAKADLDAISRWVRAEIAAHGAVHIQKDSGMFEAVKQTRD